MFLFPAGGESYTEQIHRLRRDSAGAFRILPAIEV